MKAKKERWTEQRVLGLLGQVFPDGQYAILQQVRSGIGDLSTDLRIADALVASTWKSRGQYFIGVEVKVSPADWQAELVAPEKSAAIQRYCKHWYIAAPKGIVQVGELPETWGLIECTDKRASITHRAPKLDAVPPDMSFVCAVLRAATKGMVPKASIEEWRQRVRAATCTGVDEGRAIEARATRREKKRLRDIIEDFEDASGLSMDAWSAGDVGAAVKGMLAARVSSLPSLLRKHCEELERAIEGTRAIINAIDTEQPSA